MKKLNDLLDLHAQMERNMRWNHEKNRYDEPKPSPEIERLREYMQEKRNQYFKM